MIYKELPTLIKTILITSKGWLVGGSINNILSNQDVKDYDIIVDDKKLFQDTIIYLNQLGNHSINTFGGLKFNINGIEIDIWCQSLNDFLSNCTKVDYIYNLNKQQIFKLV